MYLRMNLSSKEIAPLLNISPRSIEIKRYRLRKKINLERNINLNDYFINL
jgi:DNA-binding CsgD family transcriptional regulator